MDAINTNTFRERLQAPTEKHLEDYLWSHSEILGLMDVYENDIDDAIYKFLWRQIPVPSGIVDLVGTSWDHSLLVVEVKRGVIDTKAFAQLMRYMRDFKLVVSQVLFGLVEKLANPMADLDRHPLVNDTWDEHLIKGMLIGQRVEDRNLLIACETAKIDVITYTFQNGEYTFAQDISEKRRKSRVYQACETLTESPIGQLLQQLVLDEIELNRMWAKENRQAKGADLQTGGAL